MQVKIKSLQGEEFTVQAHNKQLVSQLKAAICEQTDGQLPIEKQKLVFKGRTMQDTHMIGEYSLEPDCKVHLIVQKDAVATRTPFITQSHTSSSSQFLCPAVTSSKDLSTTKCDLSQVRPDSDVPNSGQPTTQSSNMISCRFETILRKKLSDYFPHDMIDKILTHLHNEISTDVNLSSLDDLERLAKQKLKLLNE